jgi:homoserine acetyltransferase
VARDFRFHSGEVFPVLKLHYRTIGAPTGEPVLILHGTAGSGASMLSKDFADELFGPGQPLDASRYYLILPDALGTGQSTRPSDGLRAKFPRYNSEDMVEAQYRLVTEGLGVNHLRLVIGNSMGGMQAWIWGGRYPAFMDALVPMAACRCRCRGATGCCGACSRNRSATIPNGTAAITRRSRAACRITSCTSSLPPSAATRRSTSRRRAPPKATS